jgi:hypothetical protein
MADREVALPFGVAGIGGGQPLGDGNPNVTWRIARQAGIELTAGYAIRGHRVGRTDLRQAPEPT